ncbi:MAG: eukaryotic-like serine/threonine-protein kinase [Gaiellaceae bacterium]|nr:eukaryotic-like serine/threonine-protein kinase [Gaiellaceae bacterium]
MRRRVEEVREPPPRGPAGPPPGWYREYWWGLLLLALAAIALVLVIIWLVTRDKSDGNKVTVPNVIGMQESAARSQIRAQGLQSRVVRNPSSAPPGQVVSETPGAGSQLRKGQTVLLDVSSRPTQTTPTTTAKTTTVTKTTTVAVTTTATQTKTQQTSTTKTVTQPTTTAAPKTVTMPDETGQDYTQAVQALANLGLMPQTYPVASSEAQGSVVGQNPAAGSQATTDVPVRLNVSLGPGTRSSGPLPDLTGLKAIDALVKCAQAKYTCRVVFRTAPSPSTVGKVIDQQPQAGTNAPGLTQITLYVAR